MASLILISPASVKERGATIFGPDIDEITSGRMRGIWFPLINEYIHDYHKLFLGNGRYAVLTSDSFKEGSMENVGHPHNMYLELILDAGLLGFIIILSFLSMICKKIFMSLRYIKDNTLKEYQYAAIVAMIAYFIIGLMGRSLFPILQNSYFWVVLGFGVVITRMAFYPMKREMRN